MRKIAKTMLPLILLSVLLLTACSNGKTKDNGKEKVEISVVLKTVSSPYWKYVEAGAKKAGSDLGVEVKVVGPSSESEIIQQVNMLEDQISQSPSAVVISPTQAETVIPTLERLAKDKVPIVLIDTDADFKGKTSFIGTENYTAGKQAGEKLGQLLKKGDKIVLISGALGNPAIDQRIKGAKESLEKLGMIIVGQQAADSDKTKAMSVMENLLEKDEDIKGVYAGNDDMALGVLRAVQAKKTDVKIIGTDGTEEAVQSILDGGLTATVAQSPYNMGFKAVEVALEATRGEDIEKRISIDTVMIEKKNAKKQLKFLQDITK